MTVTEGNEEVTVEAVEEDGALLKVRLERRTLRGKARTEAVELHLNPKKGKFTTWPKKWGHELRQALQHRLSNTQKAS